MTLFTVGVEHTICFVHCQCEPLPVTMARARLWPSSPQYPHVAFSFDLLDWAEALLLECQVALKDLCKALYFRCSYLVEKVFTYFIVCVLGYVCNPLEKRNLPFPD